MEDIYSLQRKLQVLSYLELVIRTNTKIILWGIFFKCFYHILIISLAFKPRKIHQNYTTSLEYISLFFIFVFIFIHYVNYIISSNGTLNIYIHGVWYCFRNIFLNHVSQYIISLTRFVEVFAHILISIYN